MAKPHFLLLGLSFFLSPFLAQCWGIFGGSEKCNPSDLRINQNQTGFTALNIPQFTVEIINESWQVDAVYGVQLSCPAFASANLINPMIFRRIGLCCNCLLKDGLKIATGEIITFEYSNILPYPLAVVQVDC